MSKRIVFGIVGVAMTLSGLALAATDAKYYVGSSCSLADSPLAAHSKSDHLLRNTTGSSLFATCPIVREYGPNSVESASIDIGGSTLPLPGNVRLEMRPSGIGGVSGWASDSQTTLSGGLRYNFFTGSSFGTPSSGGGLAIEPQLPPQAFVSMYRLDEIF